MASATWVELEIATGAKTGPAGTLFVGEAFSRTDVEIA